MKKLRHFVFALFVSLLTSCAAMQPASPEINLIGLFIDEVTLSHVNMVANLRLYNPNTVSLQVESIEYQLYLNGVRVSSGRSVSGMEISANDYGSFDLRLSTAYWDLFRFVNNFQEGENIDYHLIGKVQVGGFGVIGHTFDFDHEGTIPLQNGDSRPAPAIMPPSPDNDTPS